MSGKIARIRTFLADMTELVQRQSGEAELLAKARPMLRDLIAHDDWLPSLCGLASNDKYRQYLLYCDPLQRFSVVSFVWAPGQKTPIHNHTVWGLIGMLRGAEVSQKFALEAGTNLWHAIEYPVALEPGEVDAVSPDIGDIHQVANALTDRPSISIHVYGGNIGAIQRRVFDPMDGATRNFVSGYSSNLMPNLWVPEIAEHSS